MGNDSAGSEPDHQAQSVEQLEAKLGRPPGSLAAFAELTPEQIGILSDAVDDVRERQRNAVDAGLMKVVPVLSKVIPTSPLDAFLEAWKSRTK